MFLSKLLIPMKKMTSDENIKEALVVNNKFDHCSVTNMFIVKGTGTTKAET